MMSYEMLYIEKIKRKKTKKNTGNEEMEEEICQIKGNIVLLLRGKISVVVMILILISIST